MENYKESSYLMYWDTVNLFRWVIPQKFPVDNFGWEEYKKFRKNYDDDSDKRYIFAVDAEYPKQLHDSHIDLIFLPGNMKIKKFQKLLCNLYEKEIYIVHIRTLKQALNHRLILEKVHRIINFI